MAPDGSPVAVYARLSARETPQLIHDGIAPGATILELGSGAGRLTHPLQALGHAVVAVDNSLAMLRRVHGASTVLADLAAMPLHAKFDVVLLASHFINAAERSERARLFEVCAGYVRPNGVVLIERYEPDFARTVTHSSTEVDGVAIEWTVLQRDGDCLDAAVTYRLAGEFWTQRFRAAVLDDAAFDAEARAAGLRVDRWLTPQRDWASLTRCAPERAGI